MRNREDGTIRGAADREPTLFDPAVFQISDGKNPRIAEHGAGKVEGYAMLAQIGRCFGLVPIELKLPRIHNSSPLRNELSV